MERGHIVRCGWSSEGTEGAREEPIGPSGTGSFSGSPGAGAKPRHSGLDGDQDDHGMSIHRSPTVTHKLPATVLRDQATFLASNLI